MDVWTVKRCLDWTNEYLESKGDENPRLSAQWLLTSATGLARIELYTNADRPLSPDELDAMHRMVIRRAKGEPLQYIVGETSFRTIDIICEPACSSRARKPRCSSRRCSPIWTARCSRKTARRPAARRPRCLGTPGRGHAPGGREEAARAGRRGKRAGIGRARGLRRAAGAGARAARAHSPPPREPRTARILEVGCGTGCITLSFAAERAGRVTCVATDINPQAVALACRNRDALGISPEVADFREGNLVSPRSIAKRNGARSTCSSPTRPTSHLRAGRGGSGGGHGVRAAPSARRRHRRPRHLPPPGQRGAQHAQAGGLFACELHETTLDAAAEICRRAGFERVRIARDLAGQAALRPRMRSRIRRPIRSGAFRPPLTASRRKIEIRPLRRARRARQSLYKKEQKLMKITMNKFIVRRNPAVQPPTYREIIARLLEEGYVKTRQVGSHARFRNGARLVTVPGDGVETTQKGDMGVDTAASGLDGCPLQHHRLPAA